MLIGLKIVACAGSIRTLLLHLLQPSCWFISPSYTFFFKTSILIWVWWNFVTQDNLQEVVFIRGTWTTSKFFVNSHTWGNLSIQGQLKRSFKIIFSKRVTILCTFCLACEVVWACYFFYRKMKIANWDFSCFYIFFLFLKLWLFTHTFPLWVFI